MSALDEEDEILQSIYPDEYKRLSSNQFEVTQELSADEIGISTAPTVCLLATCPSDYPESVPKFEISIREAVPNGGEDGSLLIVLDDGDKASLLEQAEENIGMAMIFTLCAVLKDNATDILICKRERAENEQNEAKASLLAKEEEKFKGTPVTKESFLMWKREFDQERIAFEQKQNEEQLSKTLASLSNNNQRRALTEQKLTGRQLFETDKALATSDRAFDEGGDDTVADISSLRVENDATEA